MEGIRLNLLQSIPKLNAFFNTKDFGKVLSEFEHYHRNVTQHFEDFEQTKLVWRKLLNSLSRQNLPDLPHPLTTTKTM